MKKAVMLAVLPLLVLGCKKEKPYDPPVKTIEAELRIINMERTCTFNIMDSKNKLIFTDLQVGPVLNSEQKKACASLTGRKFKGSVQYFTSKRPELLADAARITIAEMILDDTNVQTKTGVCASPTLGGSN